jgi:hypothetical protein
VITRRRRTSYGKDCSQVSSDLAQGFIFDLLADFHSWCWPSPHSSRLRRPTTATPKRAIQRQRLGTHILRCRISQYPLPRKILPCTFSSLLKPCAKVPTVSHPSSTLPFPRRRSADSATHAYPSLPGLSPPRHNVSC